MANAAFGIHNATPTGKARCLAKLINVMNATQ